MPTSHMSLCAHATEEFGILSRALLGGGAVLQQPNVASQIGNQLTMNSHLLSNLRCTPAEVTGLPGLCNPADILPMARTFGVPALAGQELQGPWSQRTLVSRSRLSLGTGAVTVRVL